MAQQKPKQTFGSGTWNPSTFVSEGPLEIEKLNTLDELRQACERSRRRRGVWLCSQCGEETIPGACWHCGAVEGKKRKRKAK
jgi:hypothetical protein